VTETINVLSTNKSGVDFRELRQLTKDFKGWKPDKALHKMLRTAGQLIADDAKEIIAPYSHTAGDTIKVRVTKTRVSVLAGGDGHAIAGLLEMGNKGRGKSQVTKPKFRHPVFGNKDVWVEQPTHAYLIKAAEGATKRIEVLEGNAVAEAFREYHFPVR